MKANRGRDTGPELGLRRELHRRGLRYRVHIDPVPGLRCRPDIVFTSVRVAVFVDGCFWHSCPEHATSPRANQAWWRDKLADNVRRDRRNDSALAAAGWVVVRVWEHEPVSEGADLVEEAVRRRRT
jgi:DNA mismatch endonuclease (patch repair protein)